MRIISLSNGNLVQDARVRKTARALRKCGHEVVHVSMFASNGGRDVLWPGGEIDGCKIFYASPDAIPFVGPAIDLMRPDVVHAHELECAWTYLADYTTEAINALNAGKEYREIEWSPRKDARRTIYDAHEYNRGRYWPEGRECEEPDWIFKEEFVMRAQPSDVITVSLAIVDALREDYGVEAHYIPNAPPHYIRSDRTRHILRDAIGAKVSDKVIVHSGNFTPWRGMDALLDAMVELPPYYKLACIGRVHASLPERMAKRGLGKDRVFTVSQRPYPFGPEDSPHLLDWLTGGDVAYNAPKIEASKSYAMSLPNKLFEAVFAGVPIVCNYTPDTARLVDTYSVGDLFYGGELAEALRINVGWGSVGHTFTAEQCFENTGEPVLRKIYGGG